MRSFTLDLTSKTCNKEKREIFVIVVVSIPFKIEGGVQGFKVLSGRKFRKYVPTPQLSFSYSGLYKPFWIGIVDAQDLFSGTSS